MNETTDKPPGARDALVEAAIDAFGRDGFDAVSTRRIAGAAGVNSALISYYFGGKDGLYAACTQHIADQVSRRIGPVATALLEDLPDPASPTDCAAALCGLADAMLAMLTRPESTPWARIVLREQQDPSAGFEALYSGGMGRIMALAARLCALAAGRQESNGDDRITALMVMAQAVIFRTNHAAVLRFNGWKEIGDSERTVIRAALHRNIHRILGA